MLDYTYSHSHKLLSHVQLFATPWTITYQAPLCMGFSRQEYWSGLPFPSPGNLSNTGIEPGSPTLQADALPSEPPGKPVNKCLPPLGTCYTLPLVKDLCICNLVITWEWIIFIYPFVYSSEYLDHICSINVCWIKYAKDIVRGNTDRNHPPGQAPQQSYAWVTSQRKSW